MEKKLGKWLDERHFLVLFSLLLFGVVIRFLGISIIPGGLNQDEASIGYEAFSILHDGYDRNNVKLPVHLISWGSGQNALYAYLSIPIIKLFGLNPFSVRFLNALFSSLSLFLFYLLFKSAFNKKRALIALSFLVICPWSLMSGRWGLEANIFPVLFLLGILFLFKAMNGKQKYYLIVSFCLGLSLYSYGTSYLVMPLFFGGISCYLIYFRKITFKYALGSLLLFFLIAFPIILFVIINHFDLPTIQLGEITIPRLLKNRTTAIFNLFSTNFFLVLLKNSVRFFSVFFLQTDNLLYNAIPTFGLVYHISLPFFFLGLFSVLKKKEKCLEPINFIMSAWLISSVILGITTNVNINRINIIVFPLIYFVILGIYYLKKKLREEYHTKFKKFLFLFYSISFLFFAGYYVSFFNEKNKENFSYGLGEAILFANERFPTDTINVTTHSINMPYIYVCFFSKTEPTVFRETAVYSEEKSNDSFRQVLSFDRYHFISDALTQNYPAIISKNEFLFSDISVTKQYERFGNYYVIFPENY